MSLQTHSHITIRRTLYILMTKKILLLPVGNQQALVNFTDTRFGILKG